MRSYIKAGRPLPLFSVYSKAGRHARSCTKDHWQESDAGPNRPNAIVYDGWVGYQVAFHRCYADLHSWIERSQNHHGTLTGYWTLTTPAVRLSIHVCRFPQRPTRDCFWTSTVKSGLLAWPTTLIRISSKCGRKSPPLDTGFPKQTIPSVGLRSCENLANSSTPNRGGQSILILSQP